MARQQLIQVLKAIWDEVDVLSPLPSALSFALLSLLIFIKSLGHVWHYRVLCLIPAVPPGEDGEQRFRASFHASLFLFVQIEKAPLHSLSVKHLSLKSSHGPALPG